MFRFIVNSVASLRRQRPSVVSSTRQAVRALVLGLVLVLFLAGANRLTPSVQAAEDRPRVERSQSPEDVRRLPEGWMSRQTPHFEFQAPPELTGTVERLRLVAEIQRRDLSDQLEPSPLLDAAPSSSTTPHRRHIVRVTSSDEMFRAHQPGRPPAWAAGVAYPAYGLMLLRTDRSTAAFGEGSLETVFRHELVHLLLGDLFGETSAPRWFDEGLARLMAREASIEQWVQLSQAVMMDRLIPFSVLETRFPQAPTSAELAYAQSREFLNYLIQRFGPEIIPGLVAELRQGQTLNEALWTRAQFGLKNLERQWHDHLDANYAWLSALGGGMTLLWGVAAILLVLGYVRKKDQRKERHARWEVEEAQEDERIAAFARAEAALERARLEHLQGRLEDNTSGSYSPGAGTGTTRPLVLYNGTRVRPDKPLIAGAPPPFDPEAADEDDWEDEWEDDETDDVDAGEEAPDTYDDDRDPEDRPPPGGWLH